ncbi:MAG: metallophosphoesterase [Lachnospiraceae bacterium]|nr:metallophosphoesterase [Lachnospiraceae bacterium]
MSRLKVLVISDTHRNVRKIKDVMKREKKVDLVLHMGDLEGHGEYIREITQCPLEAVRGNCDYDGEWPLETVIQLGGHVIFMTHGHRYGVDYGLYDLEDMARGCGADIAMYGHTHVPYFERQEDGFVILNPGSLGSPRQASRQCAYMVMELDEETDEIEFHQEYLSSPGGRFW